MTARTKSLVVHPHVCRCKSLSARLPYILIMLIVCKCYTLCESFFSIDTLLLQTYDVCCCITMSYIGKNN